MYKENISIFDRLVASTSYLTFGTVGFIWFVFVFLTKKPLSDYLKYHVFQSIFLAIFYFIVANLLALLMQLLSIVPFVNQLVNRIYFWLNMPFFMGFSIITACIYAILIYLIITSLIGKYSYLPWVSDIININIKR